MTAVGPSATREARIQGVLFDAADTLIELVEPAAESYARIAREYGVSLSAWRVGDAFRRIFAQAQPLAFPDAAPDELDGLERDWWRRVVRGTFRAADSAAKFTDFEAAFDALYVYFSEPSSWRCIDGAPEALTALRDAGLRTGIVSNFDGRLPIQLEAHGLAPLLDCVVLPRHVGAAKPDPEPFRHAAALLGLATEALLFVGDQEEADVAGSRNAGMWALRATGAATLAALPGSLADGSAALLPPVPRADPSDSR